MTLFTLVIIHELGHVFSALSFGWRVSSMELLPFGGVAKVDEWGTTSAKEEIIVAMSGPLMNVIMILLAYLFAFVGIWEETWTDYFIRGNLLIALFNLIPAWPLDGGKVAHALLTKYVSFHSSIYVILTWSSLVIFGLMALSFFHSSKLNLLVLCFYLLIEIRVAWKRTHYQFIRFLLAKVEQNTKQRTALRNTSVLLRYSDKIGEVVKMIKKGYYYDFHVVDAKQNLIGKLSETQVLELFFQDPLATISEGLSP